MAYSVDNDEIKIRLQQREHEQLQVFSMCEILASLTTRKELNDAVNIELKNILGFSQLIVCLEDESQECYKLFYHNVSLEYNKLKSQSYSDNFVFFSSAFNFPEPLILDKNKSDKTAGIPLFIKDAFQNAINNIVMSTLTSKYCKGVLFFGFEKKTAPERNILNMIKIISIQFGITMTNILLLEKNFSIAAVSEAYSEGSAREAATMGIIGNSKPMRKIHTLLKIVCDSNSNVLIQGESGTGKELVAKAIHYNSQRNKEPFVKINCAAIPVGLIESELFGHEKGSFTGAISQKIGKFEQAHKGTLFLDDISEMPLELQVKLLRAIQEKEIQRIGSSSNTAVDTRIITASNKNLQQEVHKGNFRTDLFYRLNVFPIDLPPLRERKSDIPDLAAFFIRQYSLKNNRPVKTIAAKALNILKGHHWPGNVRELEHVMERALLLSSEKVIKEVKIDSSKEIITASDTTIKPWSEFEKEYILRVLKLCNGKVSGPDGAASLLQIPSTTLKSKMGRLGIKKRHYISDK